jgi:Transglycosylase SLT domain
MSLEAFVRASGAVMGVARDSFGFGVGAGPDLAPMSGPSPPLVATVTGSGLAASAASGESSALAGLDSALGVQDLAVSSSLQSMQAAAGAGLEQMEAVIGGALGDILGLAAATTSPAGQQALVGALTNRLEQTRLAMTHGNAHACTCAASSAQLAAAYGGLGSSTVGSVASMGATSSMGTMMPLAAMSTMPMMAAGQMAANQGALSGNGASSQTGTQQQLPNSDGQRPTHASATTHPGSRQKPMPVNSVQYHRNGFRGGKAAVEGYIRQALNEMGITNHKARQNWMRGLLVGIFRESGYHPGAANGWDSNACGAPRADGFPAGSSRGLMQTIPSTFAAHHQPGTSRNIYNPIANIAAGMNYLMSHHHVARDGSNLHSVPQFNPNDAPQGY